MRFYIHKGGQHLQELGILALIFMPLDAKLHGSRLLMTLAGSVIIIVAGMEMERRSQ